MIPEMLRLFIIWSLLLEATAAISAETLTIKVMDEQNKGVYSRVLYKAAAAPSVLGDTDKEGAMVTNYACGAGQVLAARPFDTASYFNSNDEPCRSEVTLTRIPRMTR